VYLKPIESVHAGRKTKTFHLYSKPSWDRTQSHTLLASTKLIVTVVFSAIDEGGRCDGLDELGENGRHRFDRIASDRGGGDEQVFSTFS
jgi:hypothetical protein